jgi:hypothetical protein
MDSSVKTARVEGMSILLRQNGMNSIVISQADSEQRMHRALYFIKFLRAIILNLFLVFAGVALHFVFHVRLYPLADDTIDALQAQIDQAHAAGDPLGTHFYPFVLISTGILLPAIFVWIYLSITNVWRKALKAQAIFFTVSLLFFPFWMTSQLAFAVRYLDPLFTLFVAIYAALSVWVIGDICVALWKVARSTPRPTAQRSPLFYRSTSAPDQALVTLVGPTIRCRWPELTDPRE